VRTLPIAKPDWALFLDFDGTLVEIAETPTAIQVEHELINTLDAIKQCLNGALAIVSGRPISQIDRHLLPLTTTAAGLHGLEWRLDDGAVEQHGNAAFRAELSRIRGQLASFVKCHPGLLLEDKQLTLALHYRQAPQLQTQCQQRIEQLLADTTTLKVLQGKMVLEIKPAAIDKGAAIRRFLRQPPFRDRIPVFAGDDVTDEDGFAVVNELNGYSIRIGNDLNQVSAAQFCTPDVSGFISWLKSLPRQIKQHD
jgi:trehalose 6-phosphate phosphatase